jgi:hypothetical protein
MSANEPSAPLKVPLSYRVKAVVSGLCTVPFLFVAFKVASSQNLPVMGRLGAGLFFMACGLPFALLARNQWFGRDLQLLTEGAVRCGGCRRPVPEAQLQSMWQPVRTVLPWFFVGAVLETNKLYCRRCALTQSLGAAFLILLAVCVLLIGLVS